MALIQYNPVSECDVVDRGLSRFWDNLFERNYRDFERIIAPRAEIAEEQDAYHVSLEIPGIKKEGLKIAINRGILTVSGERKNERKEEKKNVVSSEISYGRFERQFTLPDHVEAEKIQAELDHGVLKVTIPKSEKAQPKEIEVTVK